MAWILATDAMNYECRMCICKRAEWGASDYKAAHSAQGTAFIYINDQQRLAVGVAIEWIKIYFFPSGLITPAAHLEAPKAGRTDGDGRERLITYSSFVYHNMEFSYLLSPPTQAFTYLVETLA